jgi:NAD(P)-dependent dehydrogenase (short-subunit alcohol dehydrogenase family)
MKRFEGKCVIVLGAGTGGNMGQAIARRFAEEGASVMVAGRKREPLKNLAIEIAGDHFLCDITVKSEVDALVAATLSRFGKVDVGINASGMNLSGPFLDVSTDDLEKITRAQFIGPFHFYQALVRAMLKGSGGSIIQISTAAASIMLDDHAAYMGTKAGADHVIRTIANEFGERNIRANVVAPGLTNSPMAAAAYAAPAILELFNRETPLGRTGVPEDIAAACAFLASEECYMTGQVLQVNGGVTLRRNPRAREMEAAMMMASSK